QTASGNSGPQTSKRGPSAATRRQQLEDAIAQNPNDIASRLLLARQLEADGDLAGALAQYDAVTTIAPTNAEASAQAGRILYLTASSGPADQAGALVDR